LPGFDEYLLGYANRDAVLSKEDVERIWPGGSGMLLPTILSQGRVMGTWKRIPKKDRTIIKTEFFHAFPKGGKKELEKAVERYGKFLQRPVSLDDEK
jgi:hypothetical protein